MCEYLNFPGRGRGLHGSVQCSLLFRAAVRTVDFNQAPVSCITRLCKETCVCVCMVFSRLLPSFLVYAVCLYVIQAVVDYVDMLLTRCETVCYSENFAFSQTMPQIYKKCF